MTTYTPSVGTISAYTLNTADLMIAFSEELARISPDHDLVKKAAAVQTLWAAGWNDLYDTEQASELVDELQDALSEHAPPYCWFGSHPDDGADFGYWPSMDAIEELPRISDPNEMPKGGTGEDTLYINDHGNVTVYSADGSIVLEVV